MPYPRPPEVVVSVAGLAGLRHRLVGRSTHARLAVAGAGVALLVTGLVVTLTSGSHSAVPPTPPSPTGFATSAPPLHLSFGAQPPVHGGAALPKQTCPPPTATHPTPTAVGSLPTRICIPAIGVNADIIQLGLNADRTVQVPMLSQVADAGWYKYSPEPGLDGPTIILGHIDSAQYGKGVFFDLGRLKSDDLINVARADGSVATFRIQRVAEYPKTAFPTQTVYGDTPGATIRLITCGGRFDASTGSYLDNIVAYGDLVSVG